MMVNVKVFHDRYESDSSNRPISNPLPYFSSFKIEKKASDRRSFILVAHLFA